jgi:hypothetical protein
MPENTHCHQANAARQFRDGAWNLLAKAQDSVAGTAGLNGQAQS